MRVRLLLSLTGLGLLALVVYAVLAELAVPGAAALSILTVVAVAALASRLLDRPIRQAAPFVAALSRGHRPPRLPEDVSGAEGDLYRSLNRLAEAQRLRLEELGAEKTETELLLQEMGEGVLALYPDGTVSRANAELRSVIGAHEAIEGKSVAAIFRNPDLVTFLSPETVPDGGVEGEFEVYGRTMLVAARRLPTRGIVAVFSDLTELRHLDRVRTEFVANASHELKTPLTAIRGFGETLVDPDMAPEDRIRFAGRIVDHAERMAAIVDDLLALARLEDPTRAVRREPLEVLKLTEDIISSQLERAQAAAATLSLEVAPADLRVRADPEGIRQVLENLLDNAIRHAGAKTITVRASQQSDEVLVCVEDDGRGIPEAHLERVFERFYRVDSSRSRTTGGTGLGLSIVRHWTEAMGGHAWVESALAEGTRVYVALPSAGTQTERDD